MTPTIDPDTEPTELGDRIAKAIQEGANAYWGVSGEDGIDIGAATESAIFVCRLLNIMGWPIKSGWADAEYTEDD